MNSVACFRMHFASPSMMPWNTKYTPLSLAPRAAVEPRNESNCSTAIVVSDIDYVNCRGVRLFRKMALVYQGPRIRLPGGKPRPSSVLGRCNRTHGESDWRIIGENGETGQKRQEPCHCRYPEGLRIRFIRRGAWCTCSTILLRFYFSPTKARSVAACC